MWWRRATAASAEKPAEGSCAAPSRASGASPDGRPGQDALTAANDAVRAFARHGGAGRTYDRACADRGTVTLAGTGGTLRLVCDRDEDADQVAALASLARVRVSLAVPVDAGWPLVVLSGAHWTLYVRVHALAEHR